MLTNEADCFSSVAGQKKSSELLIYKNDFWVHLVAKDDGVKVIINPLILFWVAETGSFEGFTENPDK